MSGYVRWDHAGYVERAGGIEEAERRRKALMARQSGYQPAEERKRQGLTQAELDLVTRFSDYTLTLATTEAARQATSPRELP